MILVFSSPIYHAGLIYEFDGKLGGGYYQFSSVL